MPVRPLPKHLTQRFSGSPGTTLADVIRGVDGLWKRLCDAGVWTPPTERVRMHSDESALQSALSEIWFTDDHRQLRDDLVCAVGADALWKTMLDMGSEQFDEDAWVFWRRRLGMEDLLEGRRKFAPPWPSDDEDEPEDGDYPAELYDPSDVRRVPIMIPDDKTVWVTRMDGSVAAMAG